MVEVVAGAVGLLVDEVEGEVLPIGDCRVIITQLEPDVKGSFERPDVSEGCN